MIRQRGKKAEETKKPKRRQLGILFDEELWYELREAGFEEEKDGHKINGRGGQRIS